MSNEVNGILYSDGPAVGSPRLLTATEMGEFGGLPIRVWLYPRREREEYQAMADLEEDTVVSGHCSSLRVAVDSLRGQVAAKVEDLEKELGRAKDLFKELSFDI